ncbi:MAG TPA: NERD domain-containing protein [Caldilineae bacterium]|nr:NERD domain-containing protein [Caldilineae bacterium]
MRVVTNDKLIERRARFGNIISWVGLGVLAAGMVASFRPQYIYIAFACLIIGFIAANIGTYQLRRFGRRPRPDQVLSKGLRGFDDRYVFYAWMLPSPYVLIGPPGVFVFVTRDQSGRVICEGSNWRQPFRLTRIFTALGQEGLGNPTKELLGEIEHMKRWLAERLPDGEPPPVHGAVVFIHPRVELELKDPTVPVLTANRLRSWFRNQAKKRALNERQREELESLIQSHIEGR